uniref:ACAD9/ACADV-like C-terminal domain-containing protein n=1 Tax=Salmo trutta TaxID=8032 RepID=A0A674DCY1_SALTR
VFLWFLWKVFLISLEQFENMSEPRGNLYAEEAAWTVTYECIQVMGGMGFMKVRCLRMQSICYSNNKLMALKKPLGNTGVLAGELTESLVAKAGLDTGLTLQGTVHPELATSGELTIPSLEQFGAIFVVVTDEQFVLKRVADWAIDLYAMVVFLSRAPRSLSQGHLSAQHKKCETWCNGGV